MTTLSVARQIARSEREVIANQGFTTAVIARRLALGAGDAALVKGTAPIVATGATAGIPGAFTPAGAVAPANLAAMTGITASPATAWTTGQYVACADAAHVHWSGTAWVAGNA